MGFCSDVNVSAKFELRSLLIPEIIAIEVLGAWVANLQSWRTGGRRGSRMVRFERALMSEVIGLP